MRRKTSASNLQNEKLENRSVKDKVHILYHMVIDGFSLNMFSSMQLCVGLLPLPCRAALWVDDGTGASLHWTAVCSCYRRLLSSPPLPMDSTTGRVQ